MRGIVLVLLIFVILSPKDGFSEKRNKNSWPIVQMKTDSVSSNRNDTLQKNSLKIKGHFNSVSITNNNVLTKKLDTKTKGAVNTIKINGDSNSVNINQNNQAGNVTIQQNGKGNQVNVSQSTTKSIRQDE